MHCMKMLSMGVSAMALLGCGRAPTENELRAGMERSLITQNMEMARIGGLIGQRMHSKLHSLRKLGCKEDGDHAYQCDVELDIEIPVLGRQDKVVPIRFVHTSSGWQVSR